MPGVSINVKLTGVNAALANLKGYEQRKIKAVKNAVNTSALNIQKAAKKRVPVDTGNLRARIIMEPQSAQPFTLRVGTYVHYGAYIEWGTGVFSVHPDIPGRQTPWAFPVAATSGKVDYNWPIREIGGEPMYLTRGSKPHPFLLPSFEEEKPHFVRAVKGAMEGA